MDPITAADNYKNAWSNYQTAASVYGADLANGSPQPKTTNDYNAMVSALNTFCNAYQSLKTATSPYCTT